jgi:hypothetical protein
MSARASCGVVVLLAVSPLLTTPAGAADEAIDGGTRVRIIRKGGQPQVVGRLVLRSPERLTVQTDAGRGIGILFNDVARVQVSAGRNRSKSAGVGALIGLVAAGAAYALYDGDCAGSDCARRFGLMAGPALVAGALVGSRMAPERWRDVDRVPDVGSWDRSQRFRVGLRAASGGGAQVTAALSF